MATSMSRGDKRRLELAMCLIQHPKLLLLDEPTAGMARHDTNATIDLLKQIKEGGMTKVIIEHDMHVVFSLADRISVLAGAHHRPRHARRDQERSARQGSLSRGGSRYDDKPQKTDGAAAKARTRKSQYFAVRNLKAYYGDSYIVQDVSFDINEGEILALLGRNGAGKTSTLRTIARAGSPDLRSGEIWLQGNRCTRDAVLSGCAMLGIQLVPEDRRIIPGHDR
jgi:ABC-type branched-subunit amino acid transport system ATPase component